MHITSYFNYENEKNTCVMVYFIASRILMLCKNKCYLICIISYRCLAVSSIILLNPTKIPYCTTNDKYWTSYVQKLVYILTWWSSNMACTYIAVLFVNYIRFVILNAAKYKVQNFDSMSKNFLVRFLKPTKKHHFVIIATEFNETSNKHSQVTWQLNTTKHLDN